MTPRTFALLALIAAVSSGVALSVYSSNRPWPTAAAGGPLFSTLSRDAANVERVRIAQGDAKLSIEKAGERWQIKEKNDFPASTEKIRALVQALSEARLAEPKTRREASFPILEVEDPKDNSANSHLVQLLDSSNTVMAEAIIGKTSPDAFGTGKSGTYVRRPGDTQAWLIDTEVVTGTKLSDWTQERLFETRPEKIKSASVETNGETSFDIARESSGTTFKFARVPDGKKMKFANSADDIVDTLSSFKLDEARRLDSEAAQKSDATPAGIARLETDEGLKLYLKVRKDKAGYWMTVDASGYGDGQKAAGKLMALAAGWEFKIPAAQADRIFKKQDDIFEAAPLEAAKP